MSRTSVLAGSFSIALATLLSACPSTPGDDEVGDASTSSSDDTTSDTGTSEDTTTGAPLEPVTLWLLEDIVFYDGYAAKVEDEVPAGQLRHSNALYAVKFGDEQIDQVQSTLMLGVIVGALCDNYDRIGGVNLAMVPKGATTYDPAMVERIEVARFITPFMDMNKEPKQVPYEWQASHIVPILHDEELRAAYDFWFELMIFGVPYAANNEIQGCAGRNDTQLGTLLLYTDSSAAAPEFTTLLPIAISESFNNYAEGASDMVGTTRKTRTFTLPAASDDVQLVLITSNHGANQGGEEYIRRDHYVGVDGALVHQYKPGRTSCEPFRKYNTQGNGIYGQVPKSDEEWQSFSNWCPGDVIDTRIIPLGAMTAGDHEFVIEVPDATFVDGQGDFPFSLFVQAK
jgi:hypothetical protein